MKTTLTRSELLEAQKAFECKTWRYSIQDILDSTNDENIEIQDEYIDLIKEETTWEQILYCKSLNLDLKMNLPENARNFVLKKIKGCENVEHDHFTSLYKENEKNMFYLDSENKEFWFDYYQIYKVLEEKYFLKYNEILELMNTILERRFKVKYYCKVQVITNWRGI